MPTVITPPAGGVISPGISLQVVSDFIGPIEPGSHWEIIILLRPEETTAERWSVPFISQVQQLTLSIANNTTSTTQVPLPDGRSIDVVAQIRSGAGVVDSGTLPSMTWQSTATLTQLLKELQGETGTGSFTEEDRALLTQTQEATFPAISMDALTLQEITSGPQGGFVASFLNVWIMGIIVRIAEVPPDLVPSTADGDYWFKSLAVVRIYRGSDLWKRVPVHTSSKLIDFVEEGLVTAVTSVLPLQWLLNMSVQVSFSEGVTGQVFLMIH